MEMIFLHHAQRTHAETAADNALSVLDAARARQANSPTMPKKPTLPLAIIWLRAFFASLQNQTRK